MPASRHLLPWVKNLATFGGGSVAEASDGVSFDHGVIVRAFFARCRFSGFKVVEMVTVQNFPKPIQDSVMLPDKARG